MKVTFVHNVSAHSGNSPLNTESPKCHIYEALCILFKHPHKLCFTFALFQSIAESNLCKEHLVPRSVNFQCSHQLVKLFNHFHFLIILIALTSAKAGTPSVIKESPQHHINIDLSLTVNNLLVGYDCKTLQIQNL